MRDPNLDVAGCFQLYNCGHSFISDACQQTSAKGLAKTLVAFASGEMRGRRVEDGSERLDDPAWLLDPPDGELPAPPATTRAQTLPFAELTPLDFERLCLRLARHRGDPEHWQLYGTRGQRQGGIDIYVRRTGRDGYDVWQCKRHVSFGPSGIRSAVSAFLAGSWAARAEHFVLCTSASLEGTAEAEELERQAARLHKRGLQL